MDQRGQVDRRFNCSTVTTVIHSANYAGNTATSLPNANCGATKASEMDGSDGATDATGGGPQQCVRKQTRKKKRRTLAEKKKKKKKNERRRKNSRTVEEKRRKRRKERKRKGEIKDEESGEGEEVG